MKSNPIYKGAWALGFTAKEMAMGMYKMFDAIRRLTKSSNEILENLEPKKDKKND